MRKHDPSLCDYLVVEERMEWGRSVVRSVVLPLAEPEAMPTFEEDGTNPEGYTIVGPLLGKFRRPGPSAR